MSVASRSLKLFINSAKSHFPGRGRIIQSSITSLSNRLLSPRRIAHTNNLIHPRRPPRQSRRLPDLPNRGVARLLPVRHQHIHCTLRPARERFRQVPDLEFLFRFGRGARVHGLVVGIGQHVRVEVEVAPGAESLGAPVFHFEVGGRARVVVEGGPEDGRPAAELAVLVDHCYDLVGRWDVDSFG